MLLSKSAFLKFQQCPAYFWYYINQPAVLQQPVASDFQQALAEQGKKVEQHFYQRFPGVRMILSKGSEAVEETRKLIEEGHTCIGQAAFEAAGFFAQSDLVEFKAENRIDIYEIKSSSSIQNTDARDTQSPSKEEHLADMAFQYEVASRAGYIVDNAFLIELNKEYSRSGDINRNLLFAVNNVTSDVLKLIPSIREAMHASLTYAADTTQPVTCNCKFKPRKQQCPAFAYLHPECAGYTIYDLPRMSESRILEFVDQHIIQLGDIPAKNKLSDNQRDHVQAWNEDRELIHRNAIDQTLRALTFPLYFLDYETSCAAIPLFEDTRPYQHIPFQYSLHILREVGADIEHEEFLHTDLTTPVYAISHHLRDAIGDTGTIIVWHKTFESNRNKELAIAVPQLKEFLEGLNTRMFDLKDIFSQRMYVHKDFRGSNSIKDVLPVMVPHLSYKDLPIGDGGKATSEWARMVFDVTDENEKKIIRQQLLDYCKLDTLAMVEVYRRLLQIVTREP